MVSVRTSLLVLLLVILAIFTFTYTTLSNHDVTNSTTVDGWNMISNSTDNISLIPDIKDESSNEENLTLPSKESILNGINWSNYTFLCNPYIHDYKIAEPNFVNNHTFLYVVIVIELKDVRNKTEIFNQISGVGLEARKLLGPDSGPTVWGTVDGVWVFYATMRPYEADVLTSYLP